MTVPGVAEQSKVRALQVDGARLAYVDAGDPAAEPVLLLHGYAGSHLSWRRQIPRLTRRYRVLALDWFGWGRSGRSLELDYGYDSEVERLRRALDALELDSVNLCGHDYGGFIALGLCIRHPERVRRLALLNTRAHRTFSRPWLIRFGLASLGARAPLLRSAMTRLPHAALHRRALRSQVERGVFDERMLDDYVGWMESDPAGGRWLVRFFSHYRIRPRRDLADALATIACPAAIVWGRRDPFLGPEIATELAATIPRASLTMVENAGHFVMEQSPAVAQRALEELLATQVEGVDG